VPTAPAIPDYGGRDSEIPLDEPKDAGIPTMDPIGQAVRAIEALGIVLAIVVGAVFAIKRSGLVKATSKSPFQTAVAEAAVNRFIRADRLRGAAVGKPAPTAAAKGPIELLGSQVLDGGTGVHLVLVKGRTLLLGASAQAVSVLAEWNDENAPEPDPVSTGAADRLQALLEHSRRSDLRQAAFSAGRGEDRR
jgi:flagellar biogenesis protein FliO